MKKNILRKIFIFFFLCFLFFLLYITNNIYFNRCGSGEEGTNGISLGLMILFFSFPIFFGFDFLFQKYKLYSQKSPRNRIIAQFCISIVSLCAVTALFPFVSYLLYKENCDPQSIWIPAAVHNIVLLTIIMMVTVLKYKKALKYIYFDIILALILAFIELLMLFYQFDFVALYIVSLLFGSMFILLSRSIVQMKKLYVSILNFIITGTLFVFFMYIFEIMFYLNKNTTSSDGSLVDLYSIRALFRMEHWSYIMYFFILSPLFMLSSFFVLQKFITKRQKK